jgi:hypothetical protein
MSDPHYSQEKGDPQFSVEQIYSEAEVVCPRCFHRQERQRRNICQNCKRAIPDGDARLGWNTADPKKLYSGMEEIFPDASETAPAVNLKKSRGSYGWKVHARSGLVGLSMALVLLFGLRFAYKTFVGPDMWKKMETVTAENMPKEWAPAVKFIFD